MKIPQYQATFPVCFLDLGLILLFVLCVVTPASTWQSMMSVEPRTWYSALGRAIMNWCKTAFCSDRPRTPGVLSGRLPWIRMIGWMDGVLFDVDNGASDRSEEPKNIFEP